jgi:hypothetical protein
MASEKERRRSARGRKTNSDGEASESSSSSYYSAPADHHAESRLQLPHHDGSTAPVRLNTEIDPNRHAPRDSLSRHLTSDESAAQSGLSGGVSAFPASSNASTAQLLYTPVPPSARDDRRTSQHEANAHVGPAQSTSLSAERLDKLSAIFDDLRRAHTPDSFAQIVASITGVTTTPSEALRQQPPSSEQTVYHNVSSSSPPNSPTREVVDVDQPRFILYSPDDQHQESSASGLAGSGVKRNVPGHPSSSSSSEPQDGGNAQPTVIISPRRERVVDRCPVCLVPRGDWPRDHNPFNCIISNASRSILEEQQLRQISVSRRQLTSMGLGQGLMVNYSGMESNSRDPPPRSSDYLPMPPSQLGCVPAADRFPVNPTVGWNVPAYPHQPRTLASTEAVRPTVPAHARTIDPRIQAVRAAEREAYAAGVDVVGSESRSHDSHSEHSGSGSVSSSSYQPSLDRTSSQSSTPPAWVSALRADINRDTSAIRQDFTALAAQVSALAQLQQTMQQQFFPPMLPMPMGFPQPMPFPVPHQFQPRPTVGRPLNDDPTLSVQPRAGHLSQDPLAPGQHVRFSDMLGVNSPSMMHTQRPRSSMRGAPELEPDDIGNVQKFNDFLKRHAQYAAQAREQGCTWSSVAGLLSRYADDLATAFSAVALKRGDQRMFDSNMVLNLTDDVFEKLYVEACCPSVEYPSQVIQHLETTAFIHQGPHEASPLPAVMRAAEAFRVQLRLLPTHAVVQCTPESVCKAWFQLLFGEDAARRRMDFQAVTTWEEARKALILRATNNPSWFGDSLRSNTDARPTAQAPASSTSSDRSTTSTTKVPKNSAYYEKRNEQLKKEGHLEGIDLDSLSAKQIYKLGTAARYRAKAAAEQEAKDLESKKFQDSLVKQQQDFQANMQRQLAQQQTTLLSALAKSQQPSRDQSPRDHYRSQSAEGRRFSDSRQDGHNDSRRNFNHGSDGRPQTPERRPQDNTTGGGSPSDRRGVFPRTLPNSEHTPRFTPPPGRQDSARGVK